jgi:hypothetical protein
VALPVLSADLEIAALGAARTELTLMGRCDPPLGALGRRLDQLLFQRIAEASIRSFVRRVADVLEKPPGGAPPPAGPGPAPELLPALLRLGALPRHRRLRAGLRPLPTARPGPCGCPADRGRRL